MYLTSKSPVEIDTELARIWGEKQSAMMRLANARHYQANFKAGKIGYSDYSVEVEKALAEVNRLSAEALPFECEYDARPWNRYFLVNNSNGHVHRGMDCNTCFPDTRYSWLVELSDCDEDAMIEEWGEMACTVCFPSAPAHPRFGEPSRRDQAARAERAAEKAARDAAKAEKAMTFEDGSDFFIEVPSWRDRSKMDKEFFKTKVAARNALSGAVADLAFYGLDHPSRFQDKVAQLVPALERVGFDTAKIIAAAAKRGAKDGGQHDAAKLVADILAAASV